jgi:putrescine transport system ATP-binding protein
MIATPLKPVTDGPWLDAAQKAQILIDGVSKRYGEFVAIEQLDLSIFKGEIFALVGAPAEGAAAR